MAVTSTLFPLFLAGVKCQQGIGGYHQFYLTQYWKIE